MLNAPATPYSVAARQPTYDPQQGAWVRPTGVEGSRGDHDTCTHVVIGSGGVVTVLTLHSPGFITVNPYTSRGRCSQSTDGAVQMSQ